MPRTKFRSICQPVTRGKRSKKPKEDVNSTEDIPSAKKIPHDVSNTSPAMSKQAVLHKKPTGYRFQDATIM